MALLAINESENGYCTLHEYPLSTPNAPRNAVAILICQECANLQVIDKPVEGL